MDDMTMAAIAYDAYRTIPENIEGIPRISKKHFSKLPFERQRAWATAVDAVVDAVLKEAGVEELKANIEELQEEVDHMSRRGE